MATAEMAMSREQSVVLLEPLFESELLRAAAGGSDGPA